MSNSIIRTVNDYIEKFRYTLERLTLASVEFAENATHSQPPTSRFAEPTGCRVVVVWHSTLVVLFALPSLSNERYRRLTEFKSFFLPCAYLVGLVSIRSSETAVNESFVFFFESKS